MKDKQTTPCPTCGSPCTISWSGLDMVENSGDETLATKNYHPLPSYEEIEREQLEQQNRELKEVLKLAHTNLVNSTTVIEAASDDYETRLMKELNHAINKAEALLNKYPEI